MIASRLSKRAGLDRDEVFTTGTLHDIGELMIHTNLPELAVVIVERVSNGEDAIAVQQELLATECNTCELSWRWRGIFLRKWWKRLLVLTNLPKPKSHLISRI